MATFYTIGTDTELFATNKKGEMVALCGKIGGNKIEPLQISSLPPGFCIQEDNVAVEFNIPPTNSPHSFAVSIETMVSFLKKKLNGMGLSVSQIVSTSFPKAELTHPNALVFGCEPDYSAWTMSENPKPECADETFRTAGGHIHVGTDANMVRTVQYMDLYLGVPSVILDKSPGSMARRQLYGKAGAMRPKPYGFEYRVLSNFWVFDNNYISWVFQQTSNAVASSDVEMSPSISHRVVDCINNSDIVEAKKLVREFHMGLPSRLHHEY